MSPESTQDKRSAPKFASFKATGLAPKLQSKLGDEKATHKEFYAKRHFHREENHHYSSATLGQTRWNDFKDPDHLSKQQSSSQAFTVDSKGDTQNLRYGALHRYDVPHYRRFGRGAVLGIPRWQRIDVDPSSGAIVIIRVKDSGTSKRELQSASYRPKRELKIKPNTLKQDDTGDDSNYIGLSWEESKESSRNLLGEYDSRASSDEDVDHFAFRSAYTEAATGLDPEGDHWRNNREEESPLVSSSQGNFNFKNTLARKLRKEPSNGELWLELIDAHKAETQQIGNSTQSTTSKADFQNKIKILIDTAKEALKTVKDYAAQEKILLVYMTEAARVWDTDRLLAEWRNTISRYSHIASIHVHFLTFIQTNFAVFNFTDARSAILEAFAVNGPPRSSEIENDQGSFQFYCYFLLRATMFFRDSGYSELATSTWQAMIELNFGCAVSRTKGPSQPNDWETRLSILEEYWESEQPRIGDMTESNGQKPVEMEPSTHFEKLNQNAQSVSEMSAWGKLEKNVSRAHELGVRTTDGVDEEDPYRIVLFSDIKTLLFRARNEDENEVLISAFLIFCGLPPLLGHQELREWLYDPFIQGHNAQNLLSPPTATRDFLDNSAPFFQVDDTTLLASPDSWFRVFNRSSGDSHLCTWALRILSSLVESEAGTEYLAEYFLGLHFQTNPLSARRKAKKVLKRFPTSLRLYNAYVLIEAGNDNFKAAEAVVRTVLESNSEHEECGLLKRTWVWSLMERHALDDALLYLASFGTHTLSQGATVNDTIKILRAEKAIEHEIKTFIAQNNHELATYYLELAVLLVYLKKNASLDSSLVSFNKIKSYFPSEVSGTRPDELSHQFRARLIYIHYKRTNDLSSIKVRDVLLESIKQFPENSIFRALLEHLEPWHSANERLHSILQAVRTKAPALQSTWNMDKETLWAHISAVRHEFRRSPDIQSNKHAIRGTFERVINSEVGRHSSALWSSYCLFEKLVGDLKRARQVFYRAVRACPGVKDIYMMAFDNLCEAMTTNDLRSIYELMEDKELRIRIPLEVSGLKS